MLAVPSKETPPIVLAVSRAVAVPALPETLPVTLPVRAPTTPPVAVVTPVMTAPPDRAMLLREMFSSRATDTPLEAAVDVRFDPPVIERDSVRRLISSEPESPVTVIAAPTGAVLTDVTRPFASRVKIGNALAPPYVPAPGPASIRSIVGVEPSPDPPVTLMLEAVPDRDST